MPEAIDLLKTRRSVKAMELTGPGPSSPEIDTIVTIASRVPDHGKLMHLFLISVAAVAVLFAGTLLSKSIGVTPLTVMTPVDGSMTNRSSPFAASPFWSMSA